MKTNTQIYCYKGRYKTSEKALTHQLSDSESHVPEPLFQRRNLLAMLPNAFGRLQKKTFLQSNFLRDKLQIGPADKEKYTEKDSLESSIEVSYCIHAISKIPGISNSEWNWAFHFCYLQCVSLYCSLKHS